VEAKRVDVQVGNWHAAFIWICESGQLSVARGLKDPMRGWRSTHEAELHPVYNLRYEVTGESKKIILAVIPRPGDVDPSKIAIQDAVLRAKSLSVMFVVDNKSVAVSVDNSGDLRISEA